MELGEEGEDEGCFARAEEACYAKGRLLESSVHCENQGRDGRGAYMVMGMRDGGIESTVILGDYRGLLGVCSLFVLFGWGECVLRNSMDMDHGGVAKSRGAPPFASQGYDKMDKISRLSIGSFTSPAQPASKSTQHLFSRTVSYVCSSTNRDSPSDDWNVDYDQWETIQWVWISVSRADIITQSAVTSSQTSH